MERVCRTKRAAPKPKDSKTRPEVAAVSRSEARPEPLYLCATAQL